MAKQILYNKENLYLNYLGAYTNTYIKQGYLCLVNTLTNRTVILYGKEKQLYQLLLKLEMGISERQMLNCMEKLGLKEMYEVLLQEGLIE